eukprot:TRINITY_DN2556_c0_g1_i1.p1 TRINITY_DN2556_c0_g1~~TRINITY_DN2556_c0_g1_i1.p1  ORF type:complete len:661 (+),score=176.00 TRINITY_DN2556_c0_g1_i1:95-2077(+)
MSAKGSHPLESLFKELDHSIQNQEYESAVTASDKILNITPNDKDALQCKIVALINLSRFSDALGVVESNKLPANEKAAFDFEVAYCHYKLNRLNEALSILKKQPEPKEPRALHLEAQIHYRMEEYALSSQTYNKITSNFANDSSVNTAELRTNLCAAYVSGELIKEGEAFLAANKSNLNDIHESLYNAGCLAIEKGDIITAEKYLKQAEALCRETLTANESSEEEIQSELCIILTQLGFVYQIQNRTEEAKKLYNTVLQWKPTDEVVSTVAGNNISVVNQEKDLFDSFKKLQKAATSQSLEQKLTANQKKVINFNRCLVLLHMNKIGECRELLSNLQKQYSDSDLLTLISSALLFKEKKQQESEDLLKKFAQQHPESSARVQLSLAQLHLTKGDVTQAISVLSGIASLQNKPGMVATLVSLNEQKGDVDAAVKIFDDFCTHLSQSKPRNEDFYLRALKESANFKMKHKLPREAASDLEQVIKVNPNDLEALPGLIIAYSQFDPKLAEKYDRLPALDNQVDVDAEALENLAAPRIGAAKPGPQKADVSVQVKEKNKSVKKKKKKKILPKNFDPAKQPDPERWVPLRQRSYFKTKRSKKQKGLEKGAQGVVPVHQRPGFDKSNAPEVKTDKTEKTPAPPVKEPETNRPPPKSSGSKNKGRRK